MTVPNTYPGTATPLRGLAPFTEAERDVFFGRDGDRDAAAKIITAEGVRAALVFGEPGVGKTSFLRAGLAPHLRDHGVVALLPALNDDLTMPTTAFARAASDASGARPLDGERPVEFLARVVSQAIPGQLYVFMLDDVDRCLRADIDGRIAQELGDLFMRVITRSSGRARFLFACADSRMHTLQALEMRTGSLFPPASRFRLERFTAAQTADVLDKTLALAGIGAEPELSRAAGQELGQQGGVLPADVQMLASSLSERKVTTAADLYQRGGARELVRMWLVSAAEATGEYRQAMRLLAELAEPEGAQPVRVDVAAAEAGVEVSFAARALATLADRGVCIRIATSEGDRGDPTGAMPYFALAHEVLRSRVREIAAPVREGAKRARTVLMTAASQSSRLSLRDLRLIREEGVLPVSAAEERALGSTRRFVYTVGALAVGIPLVLLVVIYVLLARSYYLDLDGERIVARAGRPGWWSAFHWLPHSPGFGEVAADTGFTRHDLGADSLAAVKDHDVSDSIGPAMVNEVLDRLRDPMGGIVRFAMSPQNDAQLAKLAADTKDPEGMVRLLNGLTPVARGGAEEAKLVAVALADPSPAVQRAGLDLALAVARRRPGAYRAELARAMASGDTELRRLALSQARTLGAEEEGALIGAALGSSPSPAARNDLLAAFAARGDTSPQALAAAAGGILRSADSDPQLRARAWDMLDRAFGGGAEAAAVELAKVVGDSNADKKVRIQALRVLWERAPKESFTELSGHIEAAVLSDDVEVRAASLPLFARVNPEAASFKLVAETTPTPEMKVALAQSWGELAQTRTDVAAGALDEMLADENSRVRAAAAEAYGRLGDVAQPKLYKLVKDEGGPVREGAVWGLAASVEAGGSPSRAAGGIGQLWKNKGAPRRLAAEAYGRIARTKGRAVIGQLSSAARDKDDERLRAIGVDGLCAAYGGGEKKNAAKYLRGAADDESSEVRRRVAACLTRYPGEVELAGRVAPALAGDKEPGIRAEAARALRALAKAGKAGKEEAAALVRLADDSSREARIAAIEGLGALGSAPAGVDASLQTALGRGDEVEKLAIVETAEAIGADEVIGIAVHDGSPAVRARALGAAVKRKLDVAGILGAALSDASPAVRTEALRLVGDESNPLPADVAVRALEIAARDRDPQVAEAALAALSVVLEPAAAADRLGAGLGAASESERVQAARAAETFARRQPAEAIELLEPALADPAHDVRVAVARSLGAAYAASRDPAALAGMVSSSERHAARRLTAAIALALVAADPARKDEVMSALEPLAGSGAPFARFTAQLTRGLLDGNADAAGFLTSLVP